MSTADSTANQSTGPRLHLDKQVTILFLLWLSINSFILLHRGIYLHGESAKYIREANGFLVNGRVSTPNFWLYFTQIALIAACIKLHLGLAWVIAIQLLLNLVATTAFYKAILHLFANKRLATIGTVLLLITYPYQEFNSFLYTESLFFSFTLVLSCYLIRLDRISPRHLLPVISLLILICFTRPSGLLFVPPVLLYLFLKFFKQLSLSKKLAIIGAVGIGFLFILDKALGSGGELDLMLPFRDERIICGVPTLPGFIPIQTTTHGNSLYGLLYYAVHNPSQLFRMAWLRTLAFFGLYRQYFSFSHNLYLMGYFFPIHLAALASLGYWIRANRYPFYYFASAIGMTWLTVMMTCDDWHNRFYLTICPFLIILALPALRKLFKL